MKQRFIYILLFIPFILNAQKDGSMLKVNVEGLRNTTGTLRITLFSSADGFPEDAEKSYDARSIDITDREMSFYFSDIPQGNYAFAILHDEDGDGKMRKNLVGIPREGFAFSENYKPKISSPSFEDAMFEVKKGVNVERVSIIYY